MAPNKIIIDTDPGVDDVLAMLLALAASPDELEVAMLSVTYGNVPLQSCLRNVVGMFHVIQKELEWRKSTGRPEGFETLKASKPVVAAGAVHPLEDEALAEDGFHGADGLHNVHATLAHLSPVDTWKALFQVGTDAAVDTASADLLFTPSKEPAHKEILRILKESPVDTVSVLAVGPLTNVALAAAEDPETFLRVKELIVMGGAVDVEGNVTPVAEFNCFADPVAAARVYALTSYSPQSTMPHATQASLAPYPAKLSRQLKLTLCPLDITTPHELTKNYFAERIKSLLDAGSPLAQWTSHFIFGAFGKIESMWDGGGELGFSLHDPLTVWYAMTHGDPAWKLLDRPEDIRVETSGQWTRGMHIADRRGKTKPAEVAALASPNPQEDPNIIAIDEVLGDEMAWLSVLKGNRVQRIIASPGEKVFKQVLMDRIFGN